jgi:hypothetical protein
MSPICVGSVRSTRVLAGKDCSVSAFSEAILLREERMSAVWYYAVGDRRVGPLGRVRFAGRHRFPGLGRRDRMGGGSTSGCRPERFPKFQLSIPPPLPARSSGGGAAQAMAFVDDDGKPQITPAFTAAGKKRVQVGWHQQMRGSFLSVSGARCSNQHRRLKGGSTMRENCVCLGIGDTRATFQGHQVPPQDSTTGPRQRREKPESVPRSAGAVISARWAFLLRVWVWSHHLAIQVPARMPEHGHHNRQADEQWQRAN